MDRNASWEGEISLSLSLRLFHSFSFSLSFGTQSVSNLSVKVNKKGQKYPVQICAKNSSFTVNSSLIAAGSYDKTYRLLPSNS